jgi:hypothetical protein
VKYRQHGLKYVGKNGENKIYMDPPDKVAVEHATWTTMFKRSINYFVTHNVCHMLMAFVN